MEQEKKIKTESGNWIKQSFKTGKYTEYLEKSKAGLLADDSGDEDANKYDSKFKYNLLCFSEIIRSKVDRIVRL